MYKRIITLLLVSICSSVLKADQDEFPETVLMKAWQAAIDEDAKALRQCFEVNADNKYANDILDGYISLRIAQQRLDRLCTKKFGATIRSIHTDNPLYQYLTPDTGDTLRDLLSSAHLDVSRTVVKISFTNTKFNQKDPIDVWLIKVGTEWKIDYERIAFSGYRKGLHPIDLTAEENYRRVFVLISIQSDVIRMNKLYDQIEAGKIMTVDEANKFGSTTRGATQPSTRPTTRPVRKP